MNTEKVGSPLTTPRKLKFEQLRADYELFLQTFEKPTWLYRHLQRRHQLSPFMLNRNLLYLKNIPKQKAAKKKQTNKRDTFKLDQLLEKLPSSLEKEDEEDCDEKQYFLNLSFGGFFHGPGFAEDIFLTNDPNLQQLYKDESVQVDIHLIQMYHKRKKDKDAPMEVHLLGACKAPWNPRSQLLLPCASVQLSVPPSAFSENGRVIKTHILSITVSIFVPKRVKRKRGKKKKEPVETDNEQTDSPPAKRLKSENGSESVLDDSTDLVELKVVETVLASYAAELIVYDRHKNCLLTDGDYELLLQPNSECAENNNKNSSWESKFKSKLGPFAAFSFGPTIKFSLRWERKPLLVTSYKLLASSYQDPPQVLTNALNGTSKTKANKNVAKDPPPRVFYQFLYNNSTRQQTEAKEGTHCPFCALNCKKLYGLLKHLKCNHGRFSFLYTPLKKDIHRIDICVNDNFESTLDFDGIKDMGFINIDDAPLRRKTRTEIIVGRPYVLTGDLTEFTEPDNEDIDGVAPIKGHDRVYYHTRNNLQLSNQHEMDYNSEDERAPDWLLEKTQDMIEEFTDVNAGEKALMKLWNTHILKKGYIADFTVALGCLEFVQDHGEYILKNDMKRNLLLHFVNLLEFQVISPAIVVQAMDCLQDIQRTSVEE